MHDCQTRYPILLLHGLNCRDEQGCWGRIPVLLRRHGARVYLGGQDSYGSIQHNALVLKRGLRKILAEEGCEKVNIIAHSKGGLEARYLISSLGMADQVASLSTVCTPQIMARCRSAGIPIS